MDDAFRHQALFYEDDAGFLDGTLPFIREGVKQGEPVLVAVSDRKIALLRDHLNGESDRVAFAQMGSFGRNPARILPVWRDFVAESAGPRRGIGEPAWPGRTDDELAECDRHESLLNAAFDGPVGEGFTLLCPYNTSGLDDDVLAAARRNHPEVVDEGSLSPSAEYLDPLSATDPFAGELPAMPEGAERLDFAAGSLAGVRRLVGAAADYVGLAPEARAGVVLAVHELAANSVRHGGGSGSVAVWDSDGALVCQVEDAGLFSDRLVGRHRPDLEQLNGRGLWIVNQLCDLVQVRSNAAGSVVRVRVAA